MIWISPTLKAMMIMKSRNPPESNAIKAMKKGNFLIWFKTFDTLPDDLSIPIAKLIELNKLDNIIRYNATKHKTPIKAY